MIREAAQGLAGGELGKDAWMEKHGGEVRPSGALGGFPENRVPISPLSFSIPCYLRELPSTRCFGKFLDATHRKLKRAVTVNHLTDLNS